jgi:hypothetical protein
MLTLRALGLVDQLLEHSIPIGNVARLAAFQASEKHLGGARVMSAQLQRADHFALMSDVPFPAMEKAFGFLKKLFQGSAVHSGAYQPNRRYGYSATIWMRAARQSG